MESADAAEGFAPIVLDRTQFDIVTGEVDEGVLDGRERIEELLRDERVVEAERDTDLQ